MSRSEEADSASRFSSLLLLLLEPESNCGSSGAGVLGRASSEAWERKEDSTVMRIEVWEAAAAGEVWVVAEVDEE